MKFDTKCTKVFTEMTVELTSHEAQVLLAAGLQAMLQEAARLPRTGLFEANVELSADGAVVTFRPMQPKG